jgi:hypothetical protein
VTAQVWSFKLLRGSAIDVDDAAARVVEAVDQFEQSRLTATGGTDQNDELARLDRQRDVDDGGPRLVPIVKPLADAVEPDLGRGARRASKRLSLLLDGAPPFAWVEESGSRGGEETLGGRCACELRPTSRPAIFFSTSRLLNFPN